MKLADLIYDPERDGYLPTIQECREIDKLRLQQAFPIGLRVQVQADTRLDSIFHNRRGTVGFRPDSALSVYKMRRAIEWDEVEGFLVSVFLDGNEAPNVFQPSMLRRLREVPE
jgi:hypothetical protein